MRPVYVCALIFASLPRISTGAPASPPLVATEDVTVILDVKGRLPVAVLHEMEKESGDIIGASGIQLGWSMRNEALSGSFNDLVVLTFKGTCALEPAAPVYDELGPYAFTRVSNGEVQPFGEVDCDRVVGSIHSVIAGNDYAKADLLMGRALGRVVAHELVHMLTKSGRHAHEGVQKSALSGRQLISSSLPLSAIDIDRLKQEHPAAHKAVPVALDTSAESEDR